MSQANDVLDAVRNGQLNPKDKVLELIDSMNPQQKSNLKQMLPQVMGFANYMGIDTQNALSELQSRM